MRWQIKVVLLLSGFLGALALPAVHAELSATPRETAWVTNGYVRKILPLGDRFIIGGEFTRVGPYTGHLVPVNSTTGVPLATFPLAQDAPAICVSDGAGGWFVAGYRLTLGDVTLKGLGHILADGTLDPAWQPVVNGAIYTIKVSGSTVYVGGLFRSINGVPRNNIAALDAVTGNVLDWNPNAFTSQVNDILVNGSTIYVAGGFINIGGQPRNHLAALDATTGNATAWNPNADGDVKQMLLIGSTLYVCGDFHNMGGQPRESMAAVNATGSGVVTAWNPPANGFVYALASSGTILYVSGDFDTIGGAARQHLAAFDSTTGNVTAWNPNPTLGGYNHAIISCLTVSGSTLFAGGEFDLIGGQSRNNAAAFSTSTGNALAWNPNPCGAIRGLSVSGTTVNLYGDFFIVGGAERNYLAEINAATGMATAWNPNADGPVNTLKLSGSTLYVGGGFYNIGGSPRNSLAALNLSSGVATAWNPNSSGTVNDLIVDGSTIYAGGAFTSIGGQTRYYVAALDAATGNATAWNPPTLSGTVTTIAKQGSTLYVGGYFVTAGASSRNRLAAINTSTGALTSWDPNGQDGLPRKFLINGSSLIASGTFTNIGGSTYHHLVQLSLATGLGSNWNPSLGNKLYSDMFILGSNLYLGGADLRVVDLTSGVSGPWAPDFVEGGANTIALNGTTMLAGGDFMKVGDLVHPNLAIFESAQPIPTNLSATVPNATSIRWAWNDIATSDTGYRIWSDQDITSPSTPITLRTTTAANATSWLQTGLSPNTPWTFQVATVAAGTLSPRSDPFTTWTLAATALAPVVGNPSFTTLNVTMASADGNPTGTLYALRCSTLAKWVQGDGSLGAAAVWQTAGQWGTRTVTGLTQNTTYAFYARARNGAAVESANGPAASAKTKETTPPQSSAIIGAELTPYPNMVIDFTASDVGGSGVTTTRLYVKTPGAGTFTDTGMTLPGTSGSFAYTAAAGNGTYEFYTRSTDLNGNFEAAPAAADDSIIVNAALKVLSEVPRSDTWSTDGGVYAMVRSGSKIFLGGEFSHVGPYVGCGVPLSLSTAQPAVTYPKVNGTVRACIADGAGGWYIGGDFSEVGGLPRTRLARIRSDGQVDTAWNPGANATVNRLVLGGGKVYVAGTFTIIGGMVRSRLAALDADTGEFIETFAPNPDSGVSCMTVSGSTVYVGGDFHVIGGQSRQHLAALDVATGNATAWDPSPSDTVNVIVLSGSLAYIGGNFTSVGSTTNYRTRVAAVNTSTGVATAWNPSANQSVYDLVISGSRVFLAGAFNSIGGYPRYSIGAVDLSTGNTITTWNPGAAGIVHSLALNGTTLYLGGEFWNIASQPRGYAGAVPTTDPGMPIAWNPGLNSNVLDLAISGSNIYAGGEFWTNNLTARSNLAALDAATGALTSWNPTADFRVNTMAFDGNSTLFIGGAFTTVNGLPRNRVATLSTVTSAALAWNPNADNEVLELKLSGSTVYAGGHFTNIGGQPRNRIAALNAASGTATTWNPNSSGWVESLAFNGATVYAGGNFTTIGGQTRLRFAALDAAGLAMAPSITAPDTVKNLLISGSTLYVAGNFTALGGQGRNRIGAVDLGTNLVTPWNPNANNQVKDLGVIGSTIYAGGIFDTVGGVSRSGLAAIDAVTAKPLAWNPGCDGSVLAFMADGSRLWAGGVFSIIGGIHSKSIACFDMAPATPTRPSATATGTTSIRWQWIDNAYDESGYKVWADEGATTPTTPRAITAADATEWVMSGLSPNTPYAFQVASLAVSGQSPRTAVYTTYTLAATPQKPVLSNTTASSIDVAIGAGDGNPAGTQYAIHCTTNNQWVQPGGPLGATPAWQTAPTWGTRSVSGLSQFTNYTFAVRARNGGGVETADGATSSARTLETTPPQSAASIAAPSTPYTTFLVEFAASDSQSGLDSTRLWVKTPGAGFFTDTGLVLTGGSGTFIYQATAGDGTYEFYTRALDLDGNLEAAPAAADETIVLDSGLFAPANPAAGARAATWVTDGPVYAIARGASTVYLGGLFSYVGPYTGHGVVFNTSTGAQVTGLPKVEGTVLACIADGAGGWFIGGDFTQVDGTARQNLAHILPGGTLDANWKPAADGTVNTLALSGGVVYAGGQFTQVSAQTRNYLAAMNSTTGALTTWNPDANNIVYSLVVSGMTLYAGGGFTTIGGQARNRIAALNNTTGAATGWNPGASGAVRALAISGSTLYAGGAFATIGGQTRNRIAALSTVTSSSTSWNPGASSTVRAMALSGSTLYIGGDFTIAGGVTRNRLAALDTSTGTPSAWDPNASGSVSAICLVGSVIYVGGDFTSIGGQAIRYLAAVDNTSGNATAWRPESCGTVRALAYASTRLYAGGDFHSMGGVQRSNIAALDAATGAATAWNPSADDAVRALATSGPVVYAGGEFLNIGGQARNRIAALDATTGAAAATWNPGANSTVRALLLSGSTLYVSGQFTTLGGQTRNRIGALDAASASLTGFNPNASSNIYSLLASGSLIYGSGDFSAVGGQARGRIAAMDFTTGAPLAWNPAANSSAFALTLNGSTLYAGGAFASIGGQTRRYLAALDTTINTNNATAWNPDPNGTIYALANGGGVVYTGGDQTTLGGQARNRLGAVDASTGNALGWDPNLSATVRALDLELSALYVGGDFTTAGGAEHPYFVQYDLPPAAPGGVRATILSTTSIRWSWADNSVNESGFKVWADAGSGRPATLRITTASGATSWTQTALAVNSQYSFQVAAAGTVGDSGRSTALTTWTLAATPLAPVVSNPTSASLSVAIGAGDGNPAITQYALYCSVTGQWVQADGRLGGAPTWATAATWGAVRVIGLTELTPYSFSVRARNGGGVPTANGPTAGGSTLDGTPPQSFASIAAGSTYYSVISVNFLASDTGSGVASTRLYVKRPGTGAFIDTGLTQSGVGGLFTYTASAGNGVYEFYTRATDAAGNVEPTPAAGDDSILLDSGLPLPVVPVATPRAQVWMPNGDVYAVARTSATLYLGGAFTHVGPYSGNGVPLDATTGQRAATFPTIYGRVNACVPDGSGGWFVGGEFPFFPNRLAHILANGTLDSAWHPGCDGPVYALALYGGVLYVGGSFTLLDGQFRTSLAAVNSSTGAVTTWAPDVAGGVVNCLTTDGMTLYIGGSFTSINSQTRNRIASFSIPTKTLNTWNPSANAAVQALALSGATVYAGGSFSTIGGQSRGNLAALDASGNATAFAPNANAAVEALAISGSTIYAGGGFTTIGGASRNRLAALDATSGNALTWNPNVNGNVRTLALRGSLVYAGGAFTSIGSQTRARLAAIDTASGLANAWDPSTGKTVNTLAVSGTTVYAGGDFITMGGQERARLAALDATSGQLLSAWNPGADATVRSLAVSGGLIYVGGQFTTLGAQTRNRIGALNAATGAPSSWNPAANNDVLTLVPAGSVIYAGGGFTTIGGQTRNRIAALDATTGIANAWKPNASGGNVNAMVLSGSTLYAGGDFTSIGGQSRSRLAALEIASNNATGWNPAANSTVRALVISGATLYAGGDFTSIGGQARNRIAALDMATGQATAWNPNAQNSVNCLAMYGSAVFAGGTFGNIGSQALNRLAALDAHTGTALNWDPNLNNAVLALSASGVSLLVGGQFTTVGGNAWPGFAQFDMPGGTPPEAPSNPAALPLGTDSIRWSWSDNSDDETGFKLWADAGANVPTTPRPTTLSNVTNWTMGSLAANAQYSFQVAATNLGGDSEHSNTITTWTLIEPVTSVRLVGPDFNRLVVGLDSANHPTNITSGSSGILFTNLTAGTSSGWRAGWQDWESAGLTNNTRYTITAASRNGAGVATAPASANFYTKAGFPAMGSNLDANRPTGAWLGTTATLSFTNPAGFGEGAHGGPGTRVSGYRWAWNNQTFHIFNGSEPVWSTASLNPVPTGSGDWYLHLQALNAAGVNGGWNSFGPYRFDLEPPDTPAPPTAPRPVSTTTDVTFNWSVAADPGESGVAAYHVQIGTAPGENSIFDGTVARNIFTLTVSGLYDVTYYCRVRAIDAAGNTGNWSPSSSGVTVVLPPMITEHPASQTVNPGTQVTFTVTAIGSNPRSYQWRKGGVNITGEAQANLVLSDVQEDDEGTYDCIIRNAGGSATSNGALLTVNNPVLITQHPVNATVNPSSAVTFTVAATGTAPLTYRWKRGTAEITGATGPACTISSVREADEGMYCCEVTNIVGKVASNWASLSVNDPVVITQQPASATVNPGDAIAFTVVATGTAPLTYKWYKGTDLIPGATNATFRISAASNTDEGDYSCEVKNDVGIVRSTAATLSVNDPPQITLHPLSQTVGAGTVVSLRVAASGTEPLTYEWQKGGVPLADGGRVSGARTTVLTLNPVDPADAGQYRCRVSNNLASDLSNAATLAVDTRPAIILQPISRAANPGTTVTFTVQATGAGTLSYQWRKNGSVRAGATSSTLKIGRVSLADEADYVCAVTNGVGTTLSEAARLSINRAPVVLVQPIGRTVDPGSAVSFSIQSTGTLPMNYQWRKGGASLTSATLPTFAIAAAAQADEGLYDCVIANVAGTTTSQAAQLWVNDPPAITLHPVSQTVNPGVSVTFRSNASGSAPLGFQWTKDRAIIPGANSADLTILSALQADEGAYRCVITNSAGSAETNPAQLTVNDPVVVTGHPGSLSVKPSQVAVFTVTVSGTPPFAYQWKKNAVTNVGTNAATLRIEPAAQSDEGSYSCEITNVVGTVVSNPASLIVFDPVVFTQQPADATVNPGATVAFSVATTGTAPFTYKWRKGGIPIPGAVDSVYRINAVAEADQGSYDCEVTNICWPMLSNAADLMVNDPVQITQQPSSRTVNPGASVTFSVVATGTGPLTYQWKKGLNAIGGALGASYTINSAQESDEGDYRCEVTGAVGMVPSNAATLSVNDSVVITQQPLPRTVNPADSVTFTVVATGTAPLSYQWRKGEADLPGAILATFTIDSAQQADEGVYTCRVGNVTGSVLSAAANLSVNDPPQITLHPSAQTVGVGTTVIFRTAATGTDPLRYEWQKGGVPLSDGGRIAGVATPTLTITFVDLGDVGSYRCAVRNDLGEAISNAATLAVDTRPAITVHPISQSANPGTTVTFSVQASGSGTLTYQWRKNGSTITGATTNILKVGGIASADDADYLCAVTNGMGTTLSDAAHLSVNRAPVVLVQPIAATVNPGSGVSFSVQTTGTLPMSYQWRKDTTDIPGAVAATYQIAAASMADAATYRCVIRNMAGSISSQGARLVVNPTLTVTATHGLPNPPSGNNVYTTGTLITAILAGTPEIDTTGTTRYLCTGWTGGGSVAASGTTTQTSINLRLDSTLDWRFKTQYLLGAAANPPGGGSVVFEGGSTPAGGTWHDAATTVSLRAQPAPGWIFLVWTGDAAGQSNPLKLTLSRPRVPVAYFLELPAITKDPESVAVNPGATAAFTVGVRGTAVLFYQWKKDGVNLADGGRISGVQTATLQITNVGPADEGDYACEIRNMGGTAQSDGAKLAINSVIPRILVHPAPQTANPNTAATFAVVAAGLPPILYQWQKDGTDLAADARISGVQSDILAIGSLRMADAGQFRCVVTNSGGTTFSQSARLVVNPTLTVTSPHGLASPGLGAQTFTTGTLVNASVSGSPVLDTSGTMRYVATGWTGTGSVSASGATTQTSFMIGSDSTLNWTWKPQYKLTATVSPAGSGTVSSPTDWCDVAGLMTLSANPDRFHTFDHWSGDLSGSTAQALLPMTGPRSVTAHFTLGRGTVVVNVLPTTATWTLTDGLLQPHTGQGRMVLNNIPCGALRLNWNVPAGYGAPTPNPVQFDLPCGGQVELLQVLVPTAAGNANLAARIQRYLLGLDSNPAGLDQNADGKVDIVDLCRNLRH